MPKQIPKSAVEHSTKKKTTIAFSESSALNMYPCWRFGTIDMDSKWGLKSISSEFEFKFEKEILNIVYESNNDNLYNILDEMNRKHFNSINFFWEELKNKYKQEISIEIILSINKVITENIFMNKIYPGLKDIESCTWDNIKKRVHGPKGSSSNHYVQISDLIKEVRDRYERIYPDGEGQIYSLRLGGKIRLYGTLDRNCMNIMWIDLNHEIYHCDKHNT